MLDLAGQKKKTGFRRAEMSRCQSPDMIVFDRQMSYSVELSVTSDNIHPAFGCNCRRLSPELSGELDGGRSAE